MGISRRAKPNLICFICGKEFHRKQNYINNSITKEFCCSKECDREHRKLMMAGENNHQYGLTGDKNASFKSYNRISTYGYITTIVPDHPYKNSSNRVFTHRLIAEKHLLNEDNSIEINGMKYLKPDLEIHHKDENKLNNNLDNLVVLTKEEHMKLHCNMRKQPRNNKTGQFMSINIK